MKIGLLPVILFLGLFFVSFTCANVNLTDYKNTYSENFTSDVSVLEANHMEKFKVKDGKLEVEDFDNINSTQKSGELIYLINNKTYSGNYTILVDVYREKYNAQIDAPGIMVGYNAGDFYVFSSSGSQRWFSHRAINYTESIFHDYTGADKSKKWITMQINVYEDRVQLFYDGEFVKEINVKIPNGRIGLYMWECDTYESTKTMKTLYDNLLIYEPMSINATQNGTEYILEVNSTKNIKSVEFVVEETKTEYFNSEGDELVDPKITKTILETRTTDFKDKDNITSLEVINEYEETPEVSDNIVVKIYYKITDWLGGIFKSNEIDYAEEL